MDIKMLTRKEAAAWLRVSLRTLDRLVAAGEVGIVRVGGDQRGRVLISTHELERWVREQTAESKEAVR